MNNKKIGIVTFHNADNLGAVLQAYALQRTFTESFGIEAEIIDYRCTAIDNARRSAKGLKGIALSGYYHLKHRAFVKFREKYLNLSSVYTEQKIAQSAEHYDAFITGSDQVWNYECSGWDDTYFLSFVPEGKKKYSYAASIGNYCFTDEENSKIKGFLRDFSGISVREESAYRQMCDLGLEQAFISADPVVLLEKERWMQIMSKRLCKQKYVFVYLIQYDERVVRGAEEYAQKNGFKVVNNKKDLEFILHGSPTDFLSWIYYAECVFTNSFHGTTFSLIFDKPMAASVELADGGINRRVYEMLDAVNAQHCAFSTSEPVASLPDAEDGLNCIREKSLQYVERICNDL